MKKFVMTACLISVLAAAPAMAQMMDGGPQMMQQRETSQQRQIYPCQMNPGMPYGYGYGMGPGMMGGYGYGMGPGMMGGYGYGMGPGMMGGYGYGRHPGMMGGYGRGMGHHMMGGYGMNPPCGGWQGPYFESREDYSEFFAATKDQRRKLHNLMFDYREALRSPDPDREKLQKMEKEIYELRQDIFSRKAE